MDINPIGTKAAIGIEVDAKGSQQLVVLLLILAGIALGLTGYFMWHRHDLWGWMGGVTLAFAGAAIWCHSKSRPALDRAGARATRLTMTAGGVEVETDAVTLADPQAAAALERVVSAVFYRSSLPKPDGLVQPDSQVDLSPAAVEEASRQAMDINQRAAKARQRTIEMLTGSAGSAGIEVAQPAALERPPAVPDSGLGDAGPLPSAAATKQPPYQGTMTVP